MPHNLNREQDWADFTAQYQRYVRRKQRWAWFRAYRAEIIMAGVAFVVALALCVAPWVAAWWEGF